MRIVDLPVRVQISYNKELDGIHVLYIQYMYIYALYTSLAVFDDVGTVSIDIDEIFLSEAVLAVGILFDGTANEGADSFNFNVWHFDIELVGGHLSIEWVGPLISNTD